MFKGLQSLVLVNAADGDFRGPLAISDEAGVFTVQFVQLFLFSVVNNFAGLGGMPSKVILKFINQHEPLRSRILRHVSAGVSTIYSRALVEKLFKAAIEAGESRTVHELLVTGIVRSDDIVFFDSSPREGYRRLTPVEKASRLRHLDIVGLLLRFNSDVNKTYGETGSLHELGALECAIGLWGEHRPIDINLVELLLSNGATVSGKLMGTAIRWGDTAVVEKLLSRISPSEHVYCFERVLEDAAEYLRNDVGYKVVRQVMQACRDVHNNECIDSNRDCLVRAMRNAARRNNVELVDLLLPHGGQRGLNLSLTAAAQFGSHSLVRLLLAHGAHINGQEDEIDDFYTTTPLAEAIRRGDDELVALFAEEGAWEHLCFRATLEAIGHSGNSTYLHQALEVVPAPTPEMLGRGLLFAIKACHEEVALRLLEAGASADPRCRPSPLLEALRIKSQAITWAILDADIKIDYLSKKDVLEAAIAWGDLEIINALFFIHGDVNDHSRTSPLSLAIKAGNRSLIDLLIKQRADLGIDVERERGFLRPDDSDNYLSPLAAAALVRDVETAKYLLDHGANPADERAILKAISHDRMLLNDIVQKFRQRYPHGRARFGGVVLIHALQTHNEAVLGMCLRAGFDINDLVDDQDSKRVTALGFAIKNHHTCLEWIPKLLDAGGDVNMLTSLRQEFCSSWNREITFRQTALQDAIETGNLRLVEFLISRGAHVQKEAKLGLKRTPLQKACEVGSHTIVDLLLRHNADVNEAPAARGGATALQLAAKAGSLRITKKLLDLGAKIDAPGVRIGGRCAIEYAAEYGRLDMILFLCNTAGGKFATGQYKSAITLARENGHPACADLLTELSAKTQAAIDASGR